MEEISFDLSEVEKLHFFGPNNVNFKLLQAYFPKLKLIARGDDLKIIGEAEEAYQFEEKFALLYEAYQKFGILDEQKIKRILDKNSPEEITSGGEDILLFGNNGLVVKAQNESQKRLVKSVEKKDMVFALGPAGTGKTYTAVALAVRALKNKEVRKIILTRPAVEAGENLGFLPGDLKEKLDPYLMPLFDALRDMIPTEKLKYYMENNIIQIAPLAFMRGRTLDHAFVILDEAQNATSGQLKMFLTRMGRSAKFVITGDLTQIDLPKNQPSGLLKAQELFSNIEGIDIIHLSEKDIIRHQLVKDIIEAYKIAEKDEPRNQRD